MLASKLLMDVYFTDIDNPTASANIRPTRLLLARCFLWGKSYQDNP